MLASKSVPLACLHDTHDACWCCQVPSPSAGATCPDKPPPFLSFFLLFLALFYLASLLFICTSCYRSASRRIVLLSDSTLVTSSKHHEAHDVCLRSHIAAVLLRHANDDVEDKDCMKMEEVTLVSSRDLGTLNPKGF